MSPSWWTTVRNLLKGHRRWAAGGYVALALLMGSTAPAVLLAQIAGEPPAVREPIRPRLLASFAVGHIRYYELSESTRVERRFPDGTVRRWERQGRYLLRFYPFTERDNDMVEVACRVEELRYRIRQDTAQFEFDSRFPERLSARIPDREFMSLLLGTEVEILLSPYGDIADIRGEQLQWLRDFIHQQVGRDTVLLASNLAAISNARWAALFDLHKGILPGIRIREDSTWKRLITLWIEGVEWRDTATIHIARTTDTSRVVVGVLPALQSSSSRAWLPDMPRTPLQIADARGHAQIAVELAPRGLLLHCELHAHTEYDAIPLGDGAPFRQTVQVTLSWRFLREE